MMENQQTGSPQAGLSGGKLSFDKDQIISFYKNSLPGILKTVFTSPVDGVQGLFSYQGEKSFFNAAILMATTTILYIFLPYFMMGESREYMGGFGTSFKIGILILLLMLIISLISFGVKSISGKPDLKNELLTGAICGIPLIILILLIFIFQLFSKDMNISSLASNPMGGMASAGIIVGLVTLYAFLMLVNILQQSLRASDAGNTLAWYLSPIGIILSFYLVSKIGAAFF